MIVRSAAKEVSKTRSKPSQRRAVVMAPATSVPCGHAELLAQGDRDGRGVLHDDELVLVVQGVDDLLDLALFGQGPGGADGHALAAVHAARYVQALVEGRADLRPRAAADEVDGRDVLDLFADPHALAAEDALGRIADDRGAGGVQRVPRAVAGEAAAADAQLLGQLLQLAVAVADAIQAVVGMVGQQQFDDRLAGLDGAGRVGLDLHAVGRGKGAARHQAPLAFDLDHAHAAGAGGREAVDVAERGHLDARPPQRGQQHLALFGPNLSSVDFDVDHVGSFRYWQCGKLRPRLVLAPAAGARSSRGVA